MTKFISICIPAYKQPQLLKQAIESVLMQSYTNYEIIVSDDTPDNSVKKIVEQFSEKQIRYFKNETSLGSPGNWNNAIEKSKGDYIKLLHHDDFFSGKDSLQTFVSAFDANPNVDFVFSYSNIYYKKINKYYLHKQSNAQLNRIKKQPEFLFFRNCIGAPSAVLFKRDKSLIFNAGFKWLVDVEFYIKFLKQHKNFVCIPQVLITIVDGGEGQVTQDVAFNKEVVINENLTLFSQVYSENLNVKKSLLFFQELFLQFDIDSYEKLSGSFDLPKNIQHFLKETFNDLPKNKFLKKIKKRLLTSRYNKRIFKIERF